MSYEALSWLLRLDNDTISIPLTGDNDSKLVATYPTLVECRNMSAGIQGFEDSFISIIIFYGFIEH